MAERFWLGSVSFSASSAPITIGQSGHFFLRASFPPIWSLWPWVLRIAAGASSLAFQTVEDFLRLQARIDHQAIVASGPPDDIGILLKCGGNNDSNLHFVKLHELTSPNGTKLGKMRRLSKQNRSQGS